MSSSLLTIQTAETKSYKDLVKIKLGQAFSMLFNERANKLSLDPTSYPSGLKNKMLMAF